MARWRRNVLAMIHLKLCLTSEVTASLPFALNADDSRVIDLGVRPGTESYEQTDRAHLAKFELGQAGGFASLHGNSAEPTWEPCPLRSTAVLTPTHYPQMLYAGPFAPSVTLRNSYGGLRPSSFPVALRKQDLVNPIGEDAEANLPIVRNVSFDTQGAHTNSHQVEQPELATLFQKLPDFKLQSTSLSSSGARRLPTKGDLNAPKDIFSLELIHSYWLLYEDKLLRLFSKYGDPNLADTREVFLGGKVAFLFFQKQDTRRPIIWELNSNGACQAPDRMLELIEDLMTQVLSHLKDLCHDLETSEATRRTAEARILQWLFGEFFTSDSGLPVFGELECPTSVFLQRAFGGDQKLIIDYLTSESYVKTTSFELFKSWYKTLHLTMVQGNLKCDYDFSKFISRADTLNALPLKHSVVTSKGGVNSACPTKFKYEFLGNFFLSGPNNISYLSSLKIPLGDQKADQLLATFQNSGKEQVSILMAWKRVQMEACYARQNADDHFIDILVGVATGKRKTILGDKERFVRLLDTSKRPIHPARVIKKLERFLERLECYHRLFQYFADSKKIVFIRTAHEDILRWLEKELFSPDDKLPVFGKIPTGLNPYHRSSFGELQAYIIQLFTFKHSPLHYDHAVISVLGYWYKRECQDFWQAHFSHDMDFWRFIAHAAMEGSR